VRRGDGWVGGKGRRGEDKKRRRAERNRRSLVGRTQSGLKVKGKKRICTSLNGEGGGC